MKGCIGHLALLENPLSNELVGNIILNSLPKSYDQFVFNYNINGWEKTISELHMMLKTIKGNLPKKGGDALMIRDGRVKKFESKKKGKKCKKDKGKGKAVSKKGRKDTKCFHCDETMYWKRNYPKYLAKLKAKKAVEAGSSVTKEVKKVKHGDFELFIGNRQKVVIKAVEELILLLQML